MNWLEGHLRDYPGAILIVTHDRYFLDNVTGWILELDRGRGIPHEGNYTSYLKQKARRLSLEKSEDTARQKQIEMEAEWMGSSPKARQAKSKARIAALPGPRRQAGRRACRPRRKSSSPSASGSAPTSSSSPASRRASATSSSSTDLTFKLPPGGIVGVIGPNGAGKTTLFRMITGQEAPRRRPDPGRRVASSSATSTSRRDKLDGKKNVWEEISDGQDIIYLGKREINSRAYTGAFNFKGADQQKKVGQLSGGERNRVHLAKMLKTGANLLLLDEPTNDLDVETLRALEDALTDYAGCAVIISHDRFFLDRIATHMLAFEGDAHVEWFEGNFADYEEDKKRRLGVDELIPHRMKHKKFAR